MNSATPGEPTPNVTGDLRAVLLAINSLVTEGIITNYALCGAVAAQFYTEAIATYYVDLYAFFPSTGLLVELDGLYKWAKNNGFESHGEHLVIHGVPVQVLSSANELTDEGIEKALTRSVEDVEVRVMSPEYLAAIALATHRTGKDYERVRLLTKSRDFDQDRLNDLVTRYNLSQWWQEYRNRYE